MLRIIDVSTSVFYDQKLAENKMLSMINACISHELRNPLNAIIAQNSLKTDLYEEIEDITKLLGVSSTDNLAKEKLSSVLSKLKDGMKVQESSANLMNFLIQDFLDYA